MPLVAVTVMVKLPTVAGKSVETVSVEAAVPPADSARLVGFRPRVVFVGRGETVAVRPKVPVKPLRLIIVIVEVPLLPAATVILLLAAIVKSGRAIGVTTTVTVVE